MDRETLLALLTLIFLFLLVVTVFRIIFRLIKWIFGGIWRILTGKKPENDLTKSDDWLIRAQAKQEIRFQNSMPPSTHEAKPQRKTWADKRREKKGISPTGWTFNEETKMWDPPKKLRK